MSINYADIFKHDYKLAHIAIARYLYLEDKNPKLKAYGFLWDMAKIYCGYTTSNVMIPIYNSVYDSLVEEYGLPSLTPANTLDILVFDNMYLNGEVDSYLKDSEGMIGMQTVSAKIIMNLIKEVIND